MVEGHDKRIELVLFEDEGLIKMKEFKPIEMGHRSYKDKASTKGGGTGKRRAEEQGWLHEHVEANDWQGLSWILRMHANKRIATREETKLQSELDWAKEKFTYIGRKGKMNMLYYLAIKTGAEFNTYTGKDLKLTPKLKGRIGENKISYVEEDDRITISWRSHWNMHKETNAGERKRETGRGDG